MTNREYPDRPIVGVGAIILEAGRVLLARRAAEPLRGQWSIPGGMVELGETLRAACAREALEETGLEVRVGEVVDVFDSIIAGPQPSAPRYHYVLIDFLCEVVGGELRAGSDASEAQWFTESQLPPLGLRDVTLRVIEQAFRLRRPAD